MNNRRKYLILKSLALFLAINLLTEAIFPTVAMALTAGPASPDFSSFEPVATTDMVNTFSGDLTYNLPVINIPGSDGGGYAMSLSYHSGGNIEEEASWVGHGWTLNPGAINRNLRGFPDEYNGAEIKQYNKTLPNWTMTAQQMLGLEFFSQSEGDMAKDVQEQPQTSFATLDLSQTVRYNNYQGFNRMASVGIGYKGGLSLNSQFAASGVTFSAAINVITILNGLARKIRKKQNQGTTAEQPTVDAAAVEAETNRMKANNAKALKHAFRLKAVMDRVKQGALSNGNLSTYGFCAFEAFNAAPSLPDYRGFGFNFGTSVGVRPTQVPVGFEIGTSGSFQMQYNRPVNTFKAFGYMNNLNNEDFTDETNVNSLSDYYIEKESSFDQRDLFIGIPFANYDVFALSGEGLSGSFRSFNPTSGHYYPNFVASDITTLNTGFEMAFGLNIDIGMNMGVGNTKFRVKNWGDRGNTSNRQFVKGSENIFRFANDMGGKVEYTSDNDVSTAYLNVDPNIPFIKGASPKIDVDSIYNYIGNAASPTDADKKTGRSSFIEPLKSGNKVTGYKIHKEDGSLYWYDTAVYAKNEVQVSVDIRGAMDPIVDDKIVYRNTYIGANGFNEDLMNEFHTVVGEAKTGEGTKYATSYLLTAITTADYVDVNDNGPDAADFGGWTKFEYERVHEDYRWKIPYTGLNLDFNQLSSFKDDVGSVSTGEKEVYYLRRVVTKTHTAYFVTNNSNAGCSFVNPSGVKRSDGLSAHLSTGSKDAKGDKELQRLEKIILVSNSRKDKPVKTVNFSYNYELVPDVPNNAQTGGLARSASGGTGKLTLKKVWFEYEGVVNAKISPYEFFYIYKDKEDFSQGLKDKYPQLDTFFTLSDKYTESVQNPPYANYRQDGWGNNQPEGQKQAQKRRDWRYKGEIEDGSFDASAYQLKQIKLPSGGEILIEYEEKDYRYVQDREVMSMVSLKDFDDDKNGAFGTNKYIKNPWYKLNLDDIGVTSQAEKDTLVKKLTDYYITEQNRIYFKFLFQLSGSGVPYLESCNAEYIDGYVKVEKVELKDGDIKITLDGDKSKYDDGNDKNYPMTPRQACYDFYATQKIGDHCGTEFDSKNDKIEELAYGEDDDFLDDMIKFVEKMGFAVEMIAKTHGKLLDPTIAPPLKATVCRDLNRELSYLRIPMGKPKKGGGCRVKRLLTYDSGIESGDVGAMYGTVYHYEEKDGLSSGVATNEPSSMREENPLVTFIAKGNQSWLSRHTVGKDKEQSEGPIGETLLPAASVGHSRVVVENIHQGKSGDGFAIHSFYTAKDYPLDKAYTYKDDKTSFDPRKYDIGEAIGVEYSNLGDNMAKDKAPLSMGLFSYSSKKYWATQGFRFILNNMHGQAKSVEKYNSTYEQYKIDRNNVFLVFAQMYEYFEPGEMIRTLKMEGGEVKVVWDTPGKEMDFVMEMKSLKERQMDFTLEVDLSIGLSVPPPPFLTMMPSFEFAENILSTHATSKVINYPAVQRAVKVYQDGIWSQTDYLAFDAVAGQPILTRTTDIFDGAIGCTTSHDGAIYNLIVPAHWYYEKMGSKLSGGNNQLSASAGSITSYGINGNPIKSGTSGETFAYPVTGIISAQVQTFSTGAAQGWFDSNVTSDYGITDAGKVNGIYRPHAQYVYNVPLISANTNPIYEAGIYTKFVPFNFANITQNPDWIKTTEVVKYSPHGVAVEEVDVLGIPGAAKYGYNFTMPVAVASNCEYGALYFQDYENESTGTTLSAHSGKKSLRIESGSTTIIPSVQLTSRLSGSGAIVRLWLKSDQDATIPKIAVGGSSVVSRGVKIARTGEWTLYNFDISGADLGSVGSGYASVQLLYPLAGETVFVDDVKFQPKDAQVSCFVYDVATLRLITQFDDQHFGIYNQYNDEGKLVRKLIETEKGMKTIQESQYNTPKTSR